MKNMNENPCNMCMPMGGILALKGIEEAMVIIHGSQGCSTYMRRHIAEHFNEPLDVASSSLNEKGTIYGGEKNLCQAFDNVLKVYNPKVIGVLTTCLAETIGEDIDRIAFDYQHKNDTQAAIITAPTPGYGGSHSEGYWYTLRRVVEQLSTTADKHNGINVIIPHISPADIRELKCMLESMFVSYTLLPDISDTLDRPYERPYRKVPKGGTPLEEIRGMAGAAATIELGLTASDSLSPGKYLEEQYGVPLYRLPLPIGVEATDAFFQLLSKITGNSIPLCVQQQRGRLLDAMIDSHKYNFQGRAAIFGDPDHVYAAAKLCQENGIVPAVVATGSQGSKLKDVLEPVLKACREEALLMTATDFTEIRMQAVKAKVNIAIGHSDGRYLEEREGIRLIRFGFPIHDRVGGQRLLSVGYTGTVTLLDRITNSLLEKKHQNYRASMYAKHYKDLEEAN